MSLQQALMYCDASCTEELLGVYHHFSCSKRFLAELVECLKQTQSDRAASWLLKHHLEQGFLIDEPCSRKIVLHAMRVNHWESRLHLLQILPLVQIDSELVHNLFQHLRGLTAESNKLVRAWAYNGLHEIALQYPFYKPEALRLLLAAAESEAPSVQARIRKIMKTGYYDQQENYG